MFQILLWQHSQLHALMTRFREEHLRAHRGFPVVSVPAVTASLLGWGGTWAPRGPEETLGDPRSPHGTRRGRGRSLRQNWGQGRAWGHDRRNGRGRALGEAPAPIPAPEAEPPGKGGARPRRRVGVGGWGAGFWGLLCGVWGVGWDRGAPRSKEGG